MNRRFFIALLLLCLFFRVNAQGLQPGDKLPGNILTDYRGKLLILDFWATWCAPCRTMVPVFDSLQQVFKKEAVFLQVTYQTKAEVVPVLAKLRGGRAGEVGLTEDKTLHALFPHRLLPHYVWLDGDGTVLAITGHEEVTGENIRRMLSASTPLKLKKDSTVRYDAALPLFINGNGGDGSAIRYHSTLSGYVPGLKGGLTVTPFDTISGQQLTVRNVPLVWLARLAFGENGRWFPESRIQLRSRDSLQMNSRLSGQPYRDWLAGGNGYCYELLVPPALATHTYSMLKTDLERLFPKYVFAIEQRKMRSLALLRTTSDDKLKSAGGSPSADIGPFHARLRNCGLSELMARLEKQYLQLSKLPLVDLSGYAGPVDLTLDASLSDIKALNAALLPYGLRFEERPAEVEVLAIADK